MCKTNTTCGKKYIMSCLHQIIPHNVIKHMKHNSFYLQKPQTFDQSPLVTVTVHKKSMTHRACTQHGTPVGYGNKYVRQIVVCPAIRCCSAMVQTLGQWNVITRTLIAASRVREWRGLRDGARSSKLDTRHICAYRERISRHTLCGVVTGQTVWLRQGLGE